MELNERYRLTVVAREREALLVVATVVGRDLENKTLRNHGMPIELQVVLGLQFLATGKFQITTADHVGVHRSTPAQFSESLLWRLQIATQVSSG